MILDTIEQAARYAALHPLFERAFHYLRVTDLAALELGRHELDGDRLYVLLARDEGRTRLGAKLEAHRRYIDIQYLIAGDEEMGWRSTAECSKIDTPYNDGRDFLLFADPPVSWLAVPPRSLTIFWPGDAHAPLAGSGPVHKAVVKVAV
ncbi:MAG TPA: YhcH/YjgK/YiaL family protein [Pirellulales bacterium]|jgi:YhcH/YjgK/YiaL family protein|nr:YhcH/YjgK/YiaL family protein [Pirellulales bacterium]